MPFSPGSLLNIMEILIIQHPFRHWQMLMVSLSPVLASEMAGGSCPPTEQRCCSGSRLSAGRSARGVACATFACCVMGHRTAWKTFPPQKGSSNQEELYQEVAQPSPAQMLACHTPTTLQLCLP